MKVHYFLCLLYLCITLLQTFPAHAHDESIVSTIIGLGSCDGPSTSTYLNNPAYMVYNSMGELFIADTLNHKIRKIYNGVISTVAGIGYAGFNGDGKLANSTLLNQPYGLVFNSMGELIFSDSGNSRIRKILNNQTIITIAGDGSTGFIGDEGSALLARFNSPSGLAITSNDDLLIADTKNNRIRRIFNSNGTITTIAGNNQQGYFDSDNGLATNASLNSPFGVSFDESTGEIYIADTVNNLVRKILNNGTIVMAVGEGYLSDTLQFKSTLLNNPRYAMVYNGSIYIADATSYKIRKSDNGNVITIAGTGSGTTNGDKAALQTNLLNPIHIVFNQNGEMLFSETNKIRKLSNGTISTVGGIGNVAWATCVLASNSITAQPKGMAVSSNGDLFFIEYNSNIIRKIDGSTGKIATFAGTVVTTYNGDGLLAKKTNLNTPSSLSIDETTGDMYVAEQGGHRVRKILSNGIMIIVAGTGVQTYNGDGILATNANINGPTDVAVNSKTGEVYIAESSYRIRKVLANGTIVAVAGKGNPTTFNGDNILAVNAQIGSVGGMYIDSDKNELYFADNTNFRIRKVLNNGTIITIAGTGVSGNTGDGGSAINAKIGPCSGISFDSYNNELYLMDKTVGVLRKILSNGTITTIAGALSGSGTYGEGDPATSARFASPSAMIVKRNGEILIADTNKPSIRKLSTTRRCYGILASDPTVCNGVGTCVSEDRCICNPGWIGLNCSTQFVPANETSISNNTINNSTIQFNSTNDNSTLQNSTIQINSTSNENSTIFNNSTINNNTINSNDNSTTNNSTITNSTVTDNSTIINNTTMNNSTLNYNSTNSTTINNSTIQQNSTNSNTTNTNLSVNNSTNSNSTLFNSTTTNNITITNNNTINGNNSIPYNSTINNSTTNNNNTINNSTSISNNTTITNNSTINNNTLNSNTTSNDKNVGPAVTTKPCTNKYCTNNDFYALVTLLVIPIVLMIVIIIVAAICKMKRKRKNVEENSKSVELAMANVA